MFLYVRLPPFSYAKYFLSPASRVLSRNDPHPGRQISSFSKGASVAHRSDQGCRGDRTASWYLREPLAVFILFRRFMNEIGRALVSSPVSDKSRMPSSA